MSAPQEMKSISPETIKEMIEFILPLVDKLIEQSGNPFVKMAWKILRPLLINKEALAKAQQAM